MGLLDKGNPKATVGSVLWRALIAAAAGALFFFFFFKPQYKEAWPVVLPIWVLGCAAVGGLLEWQVRDC